MQQGQKIPAFNNHELAGFNHHRVGGAWTTIEKRDFSKDLPGNDQVEYGVFPLIGGRADAHRARADGVQIGPRIALAKEHGPLFHFAREGMGYQALDDPVVQLPEERMGAKHTPLVHRI